MVEGYRGAGAWVRLSGRGKPFSEEVTNDVNNEPSTGKESFPGRGNSTMLGPKVAERNELGWDSSWSAGLRQGGVW